MDNFYRYCKSRYKIRHYPVDCPGYVNVYGAIAIIIGIFWIIRGNGLRNADVSAQPSGGAEMTTPRGDYV